MPSSQSTDTIDSREAKMEDAKSMRSPLLASKQLKALTFLKLAMQNLLWDNPVKH